MNYKINLHCHTIFSDGAGSPYTMALHAKELGFTSLVITDHFYGIDVPEFMSRYTIRAFRMAVKEAKRILPIIVGLEVPFADNEILVFGSEAIKHILENGLPSVNEMAQLRKETYCAMILCHPGEVFDKAAEYVDGFEHYNHGMNYFKHREFGALNGMVRWCNSDAHHVAGLDCGYNIVDTKIENEHELIKYIKRGSQPEFYLKSQDEQQNKGSNPA